MFPLEAWPCCMFRLFQWSSVSSNPFLILLQVCVVAACNPESMATLRCLAYFWLKPKVTLLVTVTAVRKGCLNLFNPFQPWLRCLRDIGNHQPQALSQRLSDASRPHQMVDRKPKTIDQQCWTGDEQVMNRWWTGDEQVMNRWWKDGVDGFDGWIGWMDWGARCEVTLAQLQGLQGWF